MSARPGIVVKAVVPSDGGESPNRTKSDVTAEMRVFWPHAATNAQIIVAITEVVDMAKVAIKAEREGS